MPNDLNVWWTSLTTLTQLSASAAANSKDLNSNPTSQAYIYVALKFVFIIIAEGPMSLVSGFHLETFLFRVMIFGLYYFLIMFAEIPTMCNSVSKGIFFYI